MSDVEKLAETVNKETPWWAAMPILAASIVGVPSFIAISAGWYIAKHVTSELNQLSIYNQSEITLLKEAEKVNEGIIRFVESDLRVQYRTCLNASRTDQAREACITAAEREQELGLTPDEDGK